MENFKEQQDMEQKERTLWTTPATDSIQFNVETDTKTYLS
jgi:hypothetical protein